MIDEIGPTTDEVGLDSEQEALASELSDLPPSGFATMGLAPEIQQALNDMGYVAPMEVQTAVFERLMQGRDVMVQSRTGSGKTAAFGIPIAQKISPESSGVQALILAPTRELGLQVAEELKRITRYRQVAVVPIYGGAPMKPQIDALQAGAQIVAGTPGRVLDHIRRRTLKTGGIRLLVLDECDEMLSMGFQEEIENILQTLPPREERQTMLFSATIPEAIERIARRHMRDPEKISLSEDGIGVREVSHYYYMVSGLARTRDLLKVIKAEKPESAIIFCNTRDDTATVARYLLRHGYDAEAISSDLTQKDRERVMKRSRDKNLKFLVATDIAARGIDISDLSHVINYQFPESPEVYVHRTGRTGRAGKKGVALSLVGPREIGAFYYLKLIYKIRPEERELPSAEELLTMQEGEQYEKVVELVQEKPSAQYLSLARRLWQSVEGERVVGALLQRLLGASDHALPAPGPTTQGRSSRQMHTDDLSGRPVREPREPEAESSASAEAPVEREERAPARDRERDRDERRGGSGGRRGGRDRDDRRPREGARDERRERGRGGDERRTVKQWTGRGDESPAPAVAPAEGDVAVDPPVDGAPVAELAGEAAGGEVKRRRRRRRPGDDGPTDRPARERGGRERGGRERPGSERSAERTARPAAPRSEIRTQEGQEFWEAWAEDKVARSSPSIPVIADDAPAAAAPAAPARGAGNGDPDVDEDAAPVPGTARLYVNIGKREEATADDIRELLTRDLGDDGERVGHIALRNTHAYVRVPDELVDRVIETARGKTFKDREVVVERARR